MNDPGNSAAAGLGMVLLVGPRSQYQPGLESQIAAAGYEVVLAQDAFSAIRLVVVTQPDLLLFDTAAKEMEPDEFCRALKGAPGTCGIPIVLMTVAEDDARVDRAIATGADEVMMKPTEPSAIIACIHRLIERRRQEPGLG